MRGIYFLIANIFSQSDYSKITFGLAILQITTHPLFLYKLQHTYIINKLFIHILTIQKINCNFFFDNT